MKPTVEIRRSATVLVVRFSQEPPPGFVAWLNHYFFQRDELTWFKAYNRVSDSQWAALENHLRFLEKEGWDVKKTLHPR